MGSRTVRLERLSALDVANLRVEDRGLPMNVAALLVLDGDPLLDDEGEVRLTLVRELVEHRLALAPRLRQILYGPRRGAGRPVWLDVDRVDVAEHVRSVRIPAPGDEAALLAECARLNAAVLARSRPLWELWVLTGLADGHVAMLVRMHHVVADGAAALALIGTLFDDTASPPPAVPPGEDVLVMGAPPTSALVADAWRTRAVVGMRALGALRRPYRAQRAGRAAHSLAARVLAVADLLRLGRAPRLSINRPGHAGVRLVLVRGDLERARAVAHARGGTVNDVVLTAVGGGARALLRARGELDRVPVLHVSIPSSIRRPGEPLVGNRVGIRVVPVPLADPDPVHRLEQVARVTRRGKRRPPLQPAGALLQRWMVAVMTRQRLINIIVSNLPGPPSSLSFAGARVLEVFQIGVVQGNVALSVGVLSYAGQLNLEVVADADVVPDLQTFAAGIERDLANLSCAGR
jgi:WS/DGAT/MGAT family acyltransferase